jgi:hypothetical protein
VAALARTVSRPREIVPTNLEAVIGDNLMVNVGLDELFVRWVWRLDVTCFVCWRDSFNVRLGGYSACD